jgi:hypothetical protein
VAKVSKNTDTVVFVGLSDASALRPTGVMPLSAKTPKGKHILSEHPTTVGVDDERSEQVHTQDFGLNATLFRYAPAVNGKMAAQSETNQ